MYSHHHVILTLHPSNEEAQKVLQDPSNRHLICKAGPDGRHGSGSSVLCLALDRAPKGKRQHYVIGRGIDADTILKRQSCSLRHCLISVCAKRYVPMLHEQSTNGTLVDGQHCNNQVLEIRDNMEIDIAGVQFNVQIPWRDQNQKDYEYEVRRAKESRAQTPLDIVPRRTYLQSPTVVVKMVGSYKLTGLPVCSVLSSGTTEQGRIEVLRKGNSLFAGKWSKSPHGSQWELRALKTIMSAKTQHPNIIKVMEIIYHEATPVVITELLPSGNLYEALYQRQPLILGIPGNNAVSVMKQLLDVVRHLHELGIVHRAIKLDNLLIRSEDPLHIKLTGFELATPITLHSPFFAVSGHVAPEVWEHHFRDGNSPQIWDDMLEKRGHLATRPRPRRGMPVDIWSCGAVCCELTLETTPHYLDRSKSQDEQAAIYIDYILEAEKVEPAKRAKVWAEQLGLPLNSMSFQLRNFLQKLLHHDPGRRAKVEDCLENSWLMNGWEAEKEGEETQEKASSKRRKL